MCVHKRSGAVTRVQIGGSGGLPGGGELCTQMVAEVTGTSSAMCNWQGSLLSRAWGAGEGLVRYDRGREGATSPTGSPSLLLGNFSSCFLGTSYLEKRGRETLKASRWGALLLLCRHKVCATLSKNPSKC